MARKNQPKKSPAEKKSGQIKQASPSVLEKGRHSLSPLILFSFVLPIIYSGATLDPVLSIRYLVFCLFIAGYIFFYLLIPKDIKRIPLPSLIKTIIIIGLSYCLWNCISLTTAINPKESFFETSRSFANLLFLLLIMVMVFRQRSEVMGLSKALVCLSLVHSLIGILQFYEIAFTNLPGNFPPYGLMANRNLYGSAQVLLLPFCLYVLQGGGTKWRYVAIPALLSLLTSVFLSQTRSAWIATLFIGCASTAMVLFYCPSLRKKWLVGSLFTFLGTGLMIALLLLSAPEGSFTQSIQERTSAIINPYTSNAADSANTPSSTANERLVIWGKTLQLINDHKILGAGPGNWKIGIEAYGNKGLINEYGNYVLDHAHNIYLEIAGETGIPGLILFLALFILIIIAGFFTLKKVEENKKILIILMLCGLAAFAIDGCFSFPVERIEHVFYLLLMSGIILGLYLLHAPQKTVINLSKQKALALFALAALILFISIRKFNFETHAYQVKVYHSTNQYREVIAEVNESKNPFASLDVNGDPLQMFSAIANKQLKQYDQAFAEAKQALKYNPYNARVYNTLGTIYTETYKFQNAIEAYNKALAITPKSDISLKNLAVNYFNVKDFANCLATLNKIKDADKDSTLKQIKLIALQQISKGTKK